MKTKTRFSPKRRGKNIPIPQLRERRTCLTLPPQHHTAKRRRALQRMDRRRPGTQRAAVGHRHESTEQAIYPRTGTAHRRSTRRTLVSKYSKNLRTAPSLEASKSCHRRCSGHVAPAGRQGREILRKGDTAR